MRNDSINFFVHARAVTKIAQNLNKFNHVIFASVSISNFDQLEIVHLKSFNVCNFLYDFIKSEVQLHVHFFQTPAAPQNKEYII